MTRLSDSTCLNGRPLLAGDRLELRVENNTWIPVHYGWFTKGARAAVMFAVSSGRKVKLEVPAAAELRWA